VCHGRITKWEEAWLNWIHAEKTKPVKKERGHAGVLFEGKGLPGPENSAIPLMTKQDFTLPRPACKEKVSPKRVALTIQRKAETRDKYIGKAGQKKKKLTT